MLQLRFSTDGIFIESLAVVDSLVSKKGLVHMATFPLKGTSVRPLMSTKSHISTKVRDITDSKILQPICQIWLKLADLAETADTKVSRGRKRQIGITKRTSYFLQLK